MQNDWWRGAVIYQIYPRSFMDSNGDGVGDLPGITGQLAYVAELGVDGIWLSPFFTSPMQDFGYDVADYRDVDPLFGTLADFERLLARARELGLKVIIDQVYSHTSDRHPWFQESRLSRDNAHADWYVWTDPRPDGAPPNNWQSVFGGVAWEWEPRRRQYYLHNFLKSQPDLNFHNPAVREAILDIARFWLERGVDGFRLDTANFYMHDAELRDNPPKPVTDAVKPYDMQIHRYDRSRPENLVFIQELRRVLDDYPGAMAVGEIFCEDQVGRMAEYTSGLGRLHTAYSFSFLEGPFEAGYIHDTLAQWESQGLKAWPSWAFSNHDRPRVVSRWAGEDLSPTKAKLLIALLGSLRGSAFLYQGEELGLPEAEIPYERIVDPDGLAFWPMNRGRDGCRTPMPWQADAAFGGFSTVEPWLPIDKPQLDRAVDLQTRDGDSVLQFTRRFLGWRGQQPALLRGSLELLSLPAPLLGFLRAHGEQRLLCVFNLSGESRELPVPAAGNWQALEGAAPGAEIHGETLALPGWGTLIASVATTPAA